MSVEGKERDREIPRDEFDNPPTYVNRREPVVIDRGQPVTITCAFPGITSEVYFAYTRPKEERPIVDDGWGQPRSRIKQISENTYSYTIDTTGFEEGACWWHMWVEGVFKASKFGRFFIGESPKQLL